MIHLKSIYFSTVDWGEKNNIIIWKKERTESTNSTAKQEAFEIKEDFKLYLCDYQSQGRGRGENTWSNGESGGSLLCSWSYTMYNQPQPISGPLFGLAVYSSLKKNWPNLPWSIKAPNDIYLESKKVAGILIECVTNGNQIRLVIGLGINVFSHPADIENASSISNEVEVSNDHWCQFLTHLKSELDTAKGRCTEQSLNKREREEICLALNANPIYTDKFTDITENCDLICENKQIPWQQL